MNSTIFKISWCLMVLLGTLGLDKIQLVAQELTPISNTGFRVLLDQCYVELLELTPEQQGTIAKILSDADLEFKSLTASPENPLEYNQYRTYLKNNSDELYGALDLSQRNKLKRIELIVANDASFFSFLKNPTRPDGKIVGKELGLLPNEFKQLDALYVRWLSEIDVEVFKDDAPFQSLSLEQRWRRSAEIKAKVSIMIAPFREEFCKKFLKGQQLAKFANLEWQWALLNNGVNVFDNDELRLRLGLDQGQLVQLATSRKKAEESWGSGPALQTALYRTFVQSFSEEQKAIWFDCLGKPSEEFSKAFGREILSNPSD